MAAELERETGYIAELFEGSNGIFEVAVDGEVIFSKRQVGRFPTRREIPKLLRNRQS